MIYSVGEQGICKTVCSVFELLVLLWRRSSRLLEHWCQWREFTGLALKIFAAPFVWKILWSNALDVSEVATADLTILIWIWSIALKPFLNLRIICHLEKLRVRNSRILKPSSCRLLYISSEFHMKDEQFFIRIFSFLSHFFFIAGSQTGFPLLCLEVSLSGSPHFPCAFSVPTSSAPVLSLCLPPSLPECLSFWAEVLFPFPFLQPSLHTS